MQKLHKNIAVLINELRAAIRRALSTDNGATARPAAMVQPLETRVLLSASPAAAMGEVSATDGAIDDGMIATATEGESIDASSIDSNAVAVQHDDRAEANDAHTRKELVFIDGDVADYQQLVDGLVGDTSDRETLVAVLDSNLDGIEQVTAILAEHSDLDAVHFVSHGTDGAVKLGNTWLMSGNLEHYAGSISQWGDALKTNGDLLIYGCDVATSSEGQELLESLRVLTNADIAASIDDTGHSSFGGDWDLEYALGNIETSVAVHEHGEWQDLLNIFVVSNTNDAGFGSLRRAINDANAQTGADEIQFNIPLSDANHFYYQDDSTPGSLSTIVATTLDDGSITDFDPDYPGTPFSWYSIKPTSVLPAITGEVIIDGTTQSGFAGTPVIEIDGTSVTDFDGNALTLQAGNSTIRGLVINRFTGTDADAIEIETADGNTIVGNYIGTDVTGTVALGNNWGVNVKSGYNTIGGTSPADRNIISGNLNEGVYINQSTAVGNVVIGNYIGTDASGTGPLGNGSSGVLVTSNATDNTIGGIAAGESNVIAFNGGSGVGITLNGTDRVTIRGNSIYSNGGLGIDLNNDGVSQINDAGDIDTNANQFQNYPVLSGAAISGSDLLVTGTLNSTAGTTFDIDFYTSTATDVSGHGEAERYLGSTQITTNGSGNATINKTFLTAGVVSGEYITATATDTNGNTSEFAVNVVATSVSAPGGVASDLTVWLRADAGVTTGAGGVSQWDNQAANTTLPDIQQSTVSKRPDLTGTLNYNPVITFDGSDDALRNASVLGTDVFASNAGSIFTVVRVNNTGVVLQWEENTNNRVNLEGTLPRFDFGDDVPPDRIQGSGMAAGYHIVNAQAAPGSPVDLEISVDGQLEIQSGASSATPLNPAVTGDFVLGEWAGGGLNADMDLAEVIVFRSDLTAAEQQRVQSYLAVKYGITLDQTTPTDYVDSADNIIWNAASNFGYGYDIAGLGQDDSSTLNQSQSSSINGGSILSVSAASNQDNGEFLIWGNDDGLLTETNSGTPVSVAQQLQRIWKVDETGELGTTTFTFDVNSLSVSGTVATDFNLIIDTDSDFSTGATVVSASSYVGGIVTFTGVNLDDGQFFTLGTDVNQAPVADIGGPYVINEGESANLVGSASSDPNGDTLTYSWDLDNDGNYGEAGEPNTETPTVSWATLQSFGIDDDGTYTIGLQVDDGNGGLATATTTLTVDNVAPTLSATGAASAASGVSYTLNLSATDPGNDTITGWTINWGDGTIDNLAGNPTTASHSYTQAGLTYNITVSATDEDGTWTSSDLIVGNWVVGSETVRRFSGTTGAFDSTLATSGGALNRPYSAIVGPDGNFYVSGYNSDNIVRYDSAGNYLGEFVTPNSGGLDKPCGMAFGPDGNLYVANFGGSSILRYNGTTGAFIDVFGSGGTLNGPSGIAWGPDGDLYASSWNTGKVVKFDGTSGGTPTTVINSGLSSPEQLVFDAAGNLYISNGPSNDVKMWDGATLTTYFSDASLNYATGLAFGPDGWLYVSSYNNNQIVRYDGSTAEIFVTAGSGGISEPEYLSFTPAHQVTVTVNNPPTITSSATPNIDENLTVVQTLTATDPELGAVTFTITGGDDAGLFFINGSDELVFSVAPDYEAPGDTGANNVYEVEVTANDNAGNTTPQLISVTVDPVNDHSPAFATPAGVNVNENATFVQTVNATDADQPGQTVTYSITGGNDSALFTIDGATGDLSFLSAPDYEAPGDTGANNVYEVEVTANDNAGNTTPQLISVTVDPVNDHSPAFATPAGVNINENTTFVQTVNATDADQPGQTVTYSITGGNDSALFTIDGATGDLSFLSAPDYEAPGDTGANNVYEVEVTANDNAGNTTPQLISVTVDPVNDHSPAFATPVGVNINENTTFVQTVNATDADQPGQTVTYAITGGNDSALFTIDGATGDLSFLSAPDYEAPGDTGANNVYEVEVTANDNAGNTTPQLISVTVDPVNDHSPAFATPAGVNINENTTFVQTVNATDADQPGQTVTYSITGGNDSALFTIDGATGDLSFLSAPDYEAPGDTGANNVYEVEVTANDNAGNTTPQLISVTVDPVNDHSPAFATPASVNINENTTFVQTVNATDADQPGQTVTYSITGGNDSALFTIDGATGDLSFLSAPDYEAPGDTGANNIYEVEVTANDNAGNTTPQLISVTVDPVNDHSPAFATPASVNVNENTTFVQTVNATDADQPGQTVTYSITGGNDSALFTIDGATGDLSFISAPDYETPLDTGANNVYEVEVTANDNAGNTTPQLISVTVDPVNDHSPAFTTPASVNVNENATFVQTVNATDADQPGQTVTYAITGGNDSALFTIDGATGDLSFLSAPDYEAPGDTGANNVYEVEVTANDNAGNTTPQLISVTVDPVNDHSPAFATPAGVNVNENATFVQTVNATDADQPGQTVTYAITGGNDSALFTIDGATGDLSFLSAPDYEAPGDTGANNVYEVEVTANDNAGNTTPQLISVTVDPVNDHSPSFATPAGVNVNENATFVQTVNATDADQPGQTVTYSITGGNDSALFTIDGATGDLSFLSAPDYEAPGDTGANNVYEVEVTANDNAGNTTPQLISVTVDPVNDHSPAFATPASVNINENTTFVQTVNATDADQPGQTVTYAITGGNDSALFTIDGATGDLSFLSAPDYEAPGDTGANNIYEVEVTANDGAGNSTPRLISITVDNVNEHVISAISDNDGGADAVIENASAGTTVDITAFAFDSDAIDSVTYALDDDGGGNFDINGVNGVVTTTAPLDAETAASHSIIVRATSTDGSFTTRTFTINVLDQNDTAPVIAVNSLSLSNGDTVSLNNSFLTSTDADITPGPLLYTVSNVSGGHFELVSSPGVAVTTFSQVQIGSGQVQFVDNGDSIAPSYDVTVSDGTFSTGPQSATINFTVNNTAPHATDISFELTTSLLTANVMSAITDVDGDPLTVLLLTGPTHGTLNLASDGTFSYSPDGSFAGNDAFSFRASDGSDVSNSATVTITVIAEFVPPEPPSGDTDPPPGEDVPEPEETDDDATEDDDSVSVEGNLPVPEAAAAPIRAIPSGDMNPLAELLEIIPKTEKESVVLAMRTRDEMVEAGWRQRTSEDLRSVQSNSFSQSQRYRRAEFTQSQQVLPITRSGRLWQELDDFQQNLESNLNLSTITIGSVGTIASGFTVGYVFWAIRSGLLLSSVVASMPAWTMFDPFVVISDSITSDEGEEESLEDIVEKQAALAANRSQAGTGTELNS